MTHLANFAVNPNALSSITLPYDLFTNSQGLSMQHSIFAINPVNRTSYGNETWILDTGATGHIIHSITLFTKITSSTSTFVQLPNGEKAIVTHIGTYKWHPHLFLKMCFVFLHSPLIWLQLVNWQNLYLVVFFFFQTIASYRTLLVGTRLEWVSCTMSSICCKIRNIASPFLLFYSPFSSLLSILFLLVFLSHICGIWD